jgi:hypothetical protein
MVCAATRLRDKLSDELRPYGSAAGGNGNDDEYVPLDNDFDADDLELPTNEEAA